MIDQTEMQRRAALWAQGKWEVPENVDTTGFDFNWRPHVYDRPYIHQFGTQWQKTGGPRFVIPEAEGVKYVETQRVVALPQPQNWVKHYPNAEIDWSWHPDDTEPPYNYVFGNQYLSAYDCNTVEYRVPGATDYKHVETVTATLTSDRQAWVQLYPIVEAQWDYSWAPHPHDPPYIYVWGNEYLDAETCPTVEYHAPGATERKFIGDRIAKLRSEPECWMVHADIDPSFDFSWAPHPWDPPYIYVWGNQFLSAEEMPTVEYHTPGATERKFMSDRVATLVNDPSLWMIHADIAADFDFTWTPHPWDPPYIYTWGNQFLSAEEMPTVEYHTPGATERKYMTDRTATLVNDRSCWKTLAKIDETTFDWNWCPHPWDPPYIYTWGNQFLSAEEMPTIEYHVSGATEVKFMDNVRATLVNDRSHWKTLAKIDESTFDWSWTPHPWDPPLIYVWGNQFLSAEEMPTVEYHVPGATERKYMDTARATLVNDPQCWKTLAKIDEAGFDYAWTPHPWDPPLIYVWGNQFLSAEEMPTVEYHVPGATERKYMDNARARLVGDSDCWRTLIDVDESRFDFTWTPHPWDPPYIYVWGNQFLGSEDMPTVEYHVPGATERKYMTDTVAPLRGDPECWRVLAPVDRATFDWNWCPHPWDPPYIYTWGNQWNEATVEPTVEYVVEGATERKYMTDTVAYTVADMQYWTVPSTFAKSERNRRFDYSWRPNPHSPPQIYQWENDGPLYTVPGATEIVLMHYSANMLPDDVESSDTVESSAAIPRYYVTTTLEDLIAEHSDEVFWALNPDLTYDGFDFDWRPDETNFRHLNVFGNALTKDTGTYYINGPLHKLGHRQLNYVEVAHNFSAQLTMIWVDMGTPDAAQRYDALRARYPQLVKLRFMTSWVDTINRAIKRSQTKLCWVLCSHYDYDGFDFDFYPSSWQLKQLHVFGTQHSHWGHTYLVNTEVFPEATRYVKVIEHLQNINHVRSRRVRSAALQHDMLWIDFGVGAQPPQSHRTVYTTPFADSYLNTIRSWLQQNPHVAALDNYRLWIVPSIVDHATFDWTFTPDPFQHDQLHVFASRLGHAKQKFGDIMLLNVGEFAGVMDTLERLEDYPKKVHYVGHVAAERLPHPVIEHNSDSQVDGIQSLVDTTTVWPYYQLRTSESKTVADWVPSVWSEEHSVVTVLSGGATDIVVPRDAIATVKNEVYDYPRIDFLPKLQPSALLDIVFISNGEPIAEQNWQYLQDTLKQRGAKNRVHRVENVNGRIASQHVAANSAGSSWYFLVNGKVQVNDTFDWSWQPDRLQRAKHYIFTVTNPVNGLQYGHQAIVANNRRLTLQTTTVSGLDFTMSSAHEVVDMNCGVALYNTDPWTTWRTAFRECVKLAIQPDSVSQRRLQTWLSVGDGECGEWSIRGAEDAVAWVVSVGSNMDELLKSYEWDWLKAQYDSRYA